MKEFVAGEGDVTPPETRRPSLTLESPIVDVVRIPSTEIEAIEAEPDPEPAPPPPPPPAIQLTESVAVSSELHHAGAHAVLAVPVAPAAESPRNSLGTVGALAGAFVGIVVASAFVVFSLAARQVEARAPAFVPVVVPVVAVAREPTQVITRAEEEELSPLPTLSPSPNPATRPSTPAAAPKAPRALVRTAPVRRPAPVVEPVASAPSKDNDFSFLENAEPPQSELKRPAGQRKPARHGRARLLTGRARFCPLQGAP